MTSHVLCDWGTGSIKSEAPTSSYLETSLLCQHLHQQGAALRSRCGAAEWLTKGLYTRSQRSNCKGHCSVHHNVFYFILFMIFSIFLSIPVPDDCHVKTKTYSTVQHKNRIEENRIELKSKWVRDLSVPMHVGLFLTGPLWPLDCCPSHGPLFL